MEFIDILGAVLVFSAAIVLIFEKNIYAGISKINCNRCKRAYSTQERLVEETNNEIVTWNMHIG